MQIVSLTPKQDSSGGIHTVKANHSEIAKKSMRNYYKSCDPSTLKQDFLISLVVSDNPTQTSLKKLHKMEEVGVYGSWLVVRRSTCSGWPKQKVCYALKLRHSCF